MCVCALVYFYFFSSLLSYIYSAVEGRVVILVLRRKMRDVNCVVLYVFVVCECAVNVKSRNIIMLINLGGNSCFFKASFYTQQEQIAFNPPI